jgi:hypothetical protein
MRSDIRLSFDNFAGQVLSLQAANQNFPEKVTSNLQCVSGVEVVREFHDGSEERCGIETKMTKEAPFSVRLLMPSIEPELKQLQAYLEPVS